jgi:Rrf2 family protein
MKLSTKARYGVKAMMELAIHYLKGPIQLKIIAKNQKISKKYLEQLFIPLKAHGLIRSIRGPSGGYVLTKHPSKIYLKEVIRLLEGPFVFSECLEDKALCPNTEVCVTRDIWQELSIAINQVLSSITLEDMVKRNYIKQKLSQKEISS